MKTPNFFNTRNERLHFNFSDTNNWLFTIIYEDGKQLKEKNYILRDLKQDKTIKKYIYKKLNFIFNVVEIEISKLSKSEYGCLLNIGTPTIYNVFKIEHIFSKKLQEVKTDCGKDYKLQEI
tara:strand:- start:4358 stop:4720 length:363 start_codon:yes stop_codon:yes gene_type:complete